MDERTLIESVRSSCEAHGIRERSDEEFPWGADELVLFIDNDSDLYHSQYLPIIKNLMRKRGAGVYDHEKSVKLWMYLVDRGAKKYMEEVGTGYGLKWHEAFPKDVRLTAARQLADHFQNEADTGAYDEYLPKKYQKKAEAKKPQRGTPDWHQHRISVDTVRNPAKEIMGGPSAAEAEDTLRTKFGYSDEEIQKLKESVSDDAVGSISHGTLRAEDLIPSFMTELEMRNPEVAQKIKDDNLGWETGGEDWWETDGPSWMLEELFDALNDEAPEGLYFGACEGDGSDFGFWQAEDFEESRVRTTETKIEAANNASSSGLLVTHWLLSSEKDVFETGADPDSYQHLLDGGPLGPYPDFEGLKGAVAAVAGVGAEDSEWFVFGDEGGRLFTNWLGDVDGYPLGEAELEQWKAGEIEAWIMTIDVRVQMVDAHEPTDAELAEFTGLRVESKSRGSGTQMTESEGVEPSGYHRLADMQELLDAGFSAEELLDALVRALSNADAFDNFSYIRRMNDLPEFGHMEDFGESKRESWSAGFGGGGNFRPGDKVEIIHGSGVNSGKTGVIVARGEVKTDGRCVPTEIAGAYQPVNWSKEVAIRLDNGDLLTMFKDRVRKVRGESKTRVRVRPPRPQLEVKRTVEIDDTLDGPEGRLSYCRDELKEAVHEWLDENSDAEEAPGLYDDIDYNGRFHEIIDSNTPVYNSEIRDLWYIYPDELSQAYDWAGIGDKSEDNWQQVAIYAYLELETSEWYETNKDAIFEEWQEGRGGSVDDKEYDMSKKLSPEQRMVGSARDARKKFVEDEEGKPVVQSVTKTIASGSGNTKTPESLEASFKMSPSDMMVDPPLTHEEALAKMRELGFEDAADGYEAEIEADKQSVEELFWYLQDNGVGAADNTYNWNWWGPTVQFRCLGDDPYKPCLMFFRTHQGGDVRGNYGEPEAFYLEDGWGEGEVPWEDWYQIALIVTDQGNIELNSTEMEGWHWSVYKDETGALGGDEADSVSGDELDDKLNWGDDNFWW